MRIRKRPPLIAFTPSTSQNEDPSLQPQPPNGREAREERVGREERNRERGRGRGRGGLHPDGDLPVDPQYGWSTDLPPSDPHPPNLTHIQVVKEEKEVELDSSSSHKAWDAHFNSNKRSESSSGAAIGRLWGDQESAVVVPKKRRGGRVVIGNGVLERNAKVKATAKSTTTATTITTAATLNNSTSISSSSNNSDEVVREEGKGSVNGKKRRSPAVLMEGSRCSRVNGRGWRCCQQTLVGYSLCEHHLGKGRFKSMSSVRGGHVSNSSSRNPKKNYSEEGDNVGSAVVQSSAHEEEEEKARQKQCLGLDNGEIRRGKKKIGTVKARSISSLLDEPDHQMAAMISSSPVPMPDINMALV